MYTELVFDFDGTIVDSQEIVDELLGSLADKYGLDQITTKVIKHRAGLPLGKKLKLLFFFNKVDKEFKGLYGENISRIRPVDGMVDVLRQLDATGIRLSILSSNTRENIEQFLALNGLTFFTAIVPARGLFGKHKAIKEFKSQIGGGKMLYFGDELRDVKACNKAGADIAFVTWGLDGNEDISGLKVNHILNTPADLLNLVR